MADMSERARRYAKLRRNAPSDFAVVLKRLGSQRAAMHYQTSLSTLTRWRVEMGLPKHYRAKPVVRMAGYRSGGERAMSVMRDMTFVGQASDMLRRFGPVSRCGQDGVHNREGTHWRCNNRVMTSGDLVRLAIRKGFRYRHPVAHGEMPRCVSSVAWAGPEIVAEYYQVPLARAVEFCGVGA